MSREIDLDQRRAVLLRPGDMLILANLGSDVDVEVIGQAARFLRDEMDLASVVCFESDISLKSIGREEIEVLMKQRKRSPRTCDVGVGGGELCSLPLGHEGGHDPVARRE
jgi:hypothetical protein